MKLLRRFLRRSREVEIQIRVVIDAVRTLMLAKVNQGLSEYWEGNSS